MKTMELRLDAGKVKRWHAYPIIGEQTVADHTYGVCQILRYLGAEGLIMFALDHDVPEHITGDIPYSAKKDNAGLSRYIAELEDDIIREYKLAEHYDSLTEPEENLLKFADLAEMGYFALRQFNLGNRYATEVLSNVVKSLHELMETPMAWNSQALEIYTGLVASLKGAMHVSK